MTKTLQNFESEITDIFKAYRISHFSLYYMKDTFYKYKTENPQIKNFVIKEKDSSNIVSFTENEINKNSENGLYQRIITGNTIAMFYNLWEDKYRRIIARHLGVRKNDIKNDFFRELSIIRQSITHNNYDAISDLEKLTTLNFVGNSKILKLSSYEVQEIYDRILSEIDYMRSSSTNNLQSNC